MNATTAKPQASAQIRPYSLTSADGVMTTLTEHELVTEMQYHGLHFSEIADHVDDVKAGQNVYAEDGAVFALYAAPEETAEDAYFNRFLSEGLNETQVLDYLGALKADMWHVDPSTFYADLPHLLRGAARYVEQIRNR